MNKNSGEPEQGRLQSCHFQVMFWVFFLIHCLILQHSVLNTLNAHVSLEVSDRVFLSSLLQPKSGGGGRRRGGQRHKGKGQNSSTNSTAAPSSSGIGGCWTALVPCKPSSLLSLHQVSSFHKPLRIQMYGARHSSHSYALPFYTRSYSFFVFCFFKKGTWRGMSQSKRHTPLMHFNVSCLYYFEWFGWWKAVWFLRLASLRMTI